MRKLVIAVVVWGAALPAWASEGSAETFLGLPVVLWKTLNFVGFFGLLAYLLAHDGEAISREAVTRAVWPEHADDPSKLAPAMLSEALERLRRVLEWEGSPTHIERLGADSIRFENTSYPGVDA